MLQPKKGLTETPRLVGLRRNAEQYNRAPVPVHTGATGSVPSVRQREGRYDTLSPVLQQR